eukprot:CAMPEP_0174959514 /NCGR_PEP_ID=MMETSP0004_2-20121128/3218_1 /TAXON_ID=420556 /ORGANISM="Ochromonas sp., Strain CCMP1393" /LENGTH=167 /DNA_ID=CAMNT_0016207839 /DNA_START=1479 /DNA_END=1982 /DNA_ORIENTATION=+
MEVSELAQFSGHGGGVDCVAVVDATRIVSGSNDKTLKLWDVTTQNCLGTFSGHGSAVRGVAAVDATRVVSGSGCYANNGDNSFQSHNKSDHIAQETIQQFQQEQQAADHLNTMLLHSLFTASVVATPPAVPFKNPSNSSITSTKQKDPMGFIEQCRKERELFDNFAV